MNNDNNINNEVENDEEDENVLTTSSDETLDDVIAAEKAKNEAAKAEAEKKSKMSKDEKKKEKAEKKANKVKKPRNTKKLKHGTMATVLTCVFLAVLVLVNVVMTMLFNKYPITIDLTKNKIYSVSTKSENYVKKVKVDVKVTIFSTESEFLNFNSSYDKQALEMLKNYCKINSHITYRFVDIDSNPEIVKNYTDSISKYDIVFETNTKVDGKNVQRTRLITPTDMVNFSDEFTTQLTNSGMTVDTLVEQYGGAATIVNYYSSYIDSSNAEQAFTSALMTVTDPNPVYVTVLTGRGELTKLTYFQKLLTANGYNVNTVDITQKDIPSDTSIIVIPAPKTDYLDAEITKISKFLNNNGDLGKQLLYVASVGQGDTPKLDEFLAEYGLKVGKGVICESSASNYYNQQYFTIASDLDKDSFMQDVTTADPKLLIEGSRPISCLFTEKDMVSTAQYVKSTSDAYTADAESGDTLTKGQQCYFAVGSKAKFTGDNNTVYSNVMVLGSNYALEDDFLKYDQYQNREYFMSVLNGITHKTDGITITPKSVNGNVFDITALQKKILKWTFCVGVPGVVLIIGVVIWLRRKNR